MDRIFAPFFCFLLVAAAQGGSHGAMSPEQYWRSILPNTPIPSSISQLLSSGHPYSPLVGLPKPTDDVHGFYAYKFPTADIEQLLKDPSMALFFLEKNLQQGKKITLHFTNMMARSNSEFLARPEANSIPFSSKDLPEILARFGVRGGSDDAAQVSRTLHYCELPANKDEKKACATSLESMVDFVTSSFGTKDVHAASTVLVSKAESLAQEYTVTGVRRMVGSGQLIACHAQSYVYAVFLCHLTEATRAYTASLVGKDGAAVEAVAVCHTDTAEWNPEQAAFQVLGVKPGTPVCHFVQPEAVVWTRSG